MIGKDKSDQNRLKIDQELKIDVNHHLKDKILFRLHQGPRLDDHARTFSSLLLATIDKRNLNPLKKWHQKEPQGQHQLQKILPPPNFKPNAQLQAMIDQGVTAALAARDANRNGDDSHTSGTGARRTERVARECTYQDFMKCQPLYFKGTEGVVELTQWFERMETVFRISNCSVENQIKFSTCTLLAGALTWWNSHVRIVGHGFAMQ
ncbi:hypothetical protein Tco_0008084 [Tanacetum coccineum]